MSSHTEAEYQAACKRVRIHYHDGIVFVDRDAMLAELNKPAIHPACYVVYDIDMVATNQINIARAMPDYSGVTNVRVLIPAETVKQQILDAVMLHIPSCDEEAVEKRLDSAIAHYSQYGPDGGTDELHGTV